MATVFARRVLFWGAIASSTPCAASVARSLDDTYTALPSFLDGKPAPLQEHFYSPGAPSSPHTAFGDGLSKATTGVPASFTIQLVGDNGETVQHPWTDGQDLFMYVWIANIDQILIAEVVDNGNGTLTATYESSFPGEYLIHVEEVLLAKKDEGRPIVDSPFALTVSGAPTLDVDALPVCGHAKEGITASFWRPGTWVSSNIASARHGVTRNGWVFQPKSCVFDTFWHEDLMRLAERTEPTWLLVLGNSVQRGVFLTLVDMILAKGQKNNLGSSIIQKCWGYADVRVGNLRVSFQDMRLNVQRLGEDVVTCHNEKLAGGSTAEFISSCQTFFASTVFGNNTAWPTVILAPATIDRDRIPDVEVPLEALPPTWRGHLIMTAHWAGFGTIFGRRQKNPTMTSLEDVGFSVHRRGPFGAADFAKLDEFQKREPRVSFMSVFPMKQGMLFENQESKNGVRRYGASIHHHYVSESPEDPETYGGAVMVHSMMTEMLANILIGKAVGTKEAMNATGATSESPFNLSPTAQRPFKVCTDCPATLLPIHVNPSPKPKCSTAEFLAIKGEPAGAVWDNTRCPSWCMMKSSVSQTHTESGPVDVRECPTHPDP